MSKLEESSLHNLSFSHSTAISTPNQTAINFENDNYFRKKKVDFSNTFKIHKLINEVLRTLDALIKEVELFPLIVKLFLDVKISQNEEEKNIIIEIPQKKCFKIWEKDLIEKTKMKIEASLLDFTSYITQPFDVNVLKINSFEIKIANFLSFFAEGKKFLDCFKNNMEFKFKHLLQTNKQKDLCKLKSINEMITFYEENKVEKDILIFFAESADRNNVCKNEKRIIGPINIIKSNQTLDINEKANRYRNYKDFYYIYFYDSDSEKMYNQNEEEAKYKIVENLCVYCKRKINTEEDFFEHTLFCKHAFLTHDKENKAKDDIINDPQYFKGNEQHLCKNEHLQCYKKFFKPFKNEIYKRYEKINMDEDKKDEQMKNETQTQNFVDPKDSLLYDFIQYRTNQSKINNVNDVYKFVSDSPLFLLRNDAYVRFNESKLKELVCDFKADALLSELMNFPTINLRRSTKIYNMKDGPLKCLELLGRINKTSAEEKTKTLFFQNYTSLKMKNPSQKIRNPYNFTGLIKCDLEINKNKLNDDMKKKCPILPFNIWLKFFSNSSNTKKINYKTRKYIFESANSYTLLSDHLFYLLENDFYSLRRIEEVCEFEACSENSDFMDNKIDDIHSYNVPKKEKEKLEADFTKNFSIIFVDNLFRKSYNKKYLNSSYKNSFYDNFCLYPRIKDFQSSGVLELSPKKSVEFKYFKIISFIYLSYMNMLTLHSSLGFILNGSNKLNKILSKDENNNKTIEKFSMFYFSCSRIIVRYTCLNEEIKGKKKKIALQSTLSFNPNGRPLYKVMNLINAYLHVRPFFTYCDNNALESDLYYEAKRLADCPLEFCKYDFLHLPFKPIKTDFTLFNKLIFDDGYQDKNDKCIKKMLTNLYNRYKKEHPSTEFKFSEVFGQKKEDFKKKIYQSMQQKMSFDNYGVKWNLDHKIPVYSLKEKKECLSRDELIQVWKHNNIIPMMIEENQKKSKNLE